ncbi:Hypothetical protein EMIHUDRAFT_450811, partial [Emiliania huxleyi CCMP1516]
RLVGGDSGRRHRLARLAARPTSRCRRGGAAERRSDGDVGRGAGVPPPDASLDRAGLGPRVAPPLLVRLGVHEHEPRGRARGAGPHHPRPRLLRRRVERGPVRARDGARRPHSRAAPLRHLAVRLLARHLHLRRDGRRHALPHRELPDPHLERRGGGRVRGRAGAPARARGGGRRGGERVRAQCPLRNPNRPTSCLP